MPRQDKVEVPNLSRLAKLIAIGGIPFPTGLPESTMEILQDEVCQLRRQRLIQHIAREIATDMRSELS